MNFFGFPVQKALQMVQDTALRQIEDSADEIDHHTNHFAWNTEVESVDRFGVCFGRVFGEINSKQSAFNKGS